MDWRNFISQDPAILGGKPCIRGTRISVQLIVEDMSDGSSIDDLISAYPFLTKEQIRAALSFAAASLASERVVFIEPSAT